MLANLNGSFRSIAPSSRYQIYNSQHTRRMPIELNVIYEDNHLLVIDKPSMLATMGVREGEDSLVQRAKLYLKEKYSKPGNVYLGVVSRLDSFVSGLIVLARTSKAAARLTDQFARRNVGKTYLAIVEDRSSMASDGVLEHFVVKDDRQKRMVTVSEREAKQTGAKLARLTYQTLGMHSGQRLLKVELETGRKHQIRIQFSACHAAIVGDRKYGSRLKFPEGIALHSHRLDFEHPTQKTAQSFQSEPPSFWRLERFGYHER